MTFSSKGFGGGDRHTVKDESLAGFQFGKIGKLKKFIKWPAVGERLVS